jgi:hypothetical protein
MSTQMGTDENEYPNLEMLLVRRKAERAESQVLKDKFIRLGAFRAMRNADREAALTDPNDPTTPKDLEDTPIELEYMRACLCRI